MQLVVIGIDHGPRLPIDGTLPPDLQGTLARVGPRHGGLAGTPGGIESEMNPGRVDSSMRWSCVTDRPCSYA